MAGAQTGAGLVITRVGEAFIVIVLVALTALHGPVGSSVVKVNVTLPLKLAAGV